MEAVRNYGLALRDASNVLKNDYDVVMHAVASNEDAFEYASPAIRYGLDEYLTDQILNVYNVPREDFISTILFATTSLPTRNSAARGGDPECDAKRACDNNSSDCALSLLLPSSSLPASLALQVRRLIWRYSGVRSGSRWKLIEAAAINRNLGFLLC